ncbi:hypothetical protein ACOMHN_037266 [Nucella lapillus]
MNVTTTTTADQLFVQFWNVRVYMNMTWRLHHAIDPNVQEHGSPSSSPPVPEAAEDRRERRQSPEAWKGWLHRPRSVH